MILNHVSVGASDVVKAVGFYDSVLSMLSIKRAHYIENIAAAYGENFEFWVGSPCEGKATSNLSFFYSSDQFMCIAKK